LAAKTILFHFRREHGTTASIPLATFSQSPKPGKF